MIPTPKPGVDVSSWIQVQSQTSVLLLFKFKRGPQIIITLPYIWHMKPGMICTNDARVVSSNDTHHHRPRVWKTSGGKLGALTYNKHMRARIPNFEILDPQVVGQWTACDTPPGSPA